MTLHELEGEMKELLAKSRPRTTLFRHTLDVVQQMAEYCRLYQPCWPVRDDSVNLPRMLAYGALVHDFGKVHADFQAVLKGSKQKFDNRHEILSLCFLDWLGIPLSERAWVESVVALHHKNLFWLTGANQRFYVSPKFGADHSYARCLAEGANTESAKLLHHMLGHAREIFQHAGWQEFSCHELAPYRELDYIGVMKQALERINGLAKQFEAETDDFGRVGRVPWELRRAGIQVRGFMLLADHLASANPHSLEVGLEDAASVGESIRKKTRVVEFRSHQKKSLGQQGSAILVAPTGTGKTEAALLWSARQAETGLRGRTFVLLPYQTSMNAMQKRLIETFLPGLKDKPELWAEHVAMVHGKSVRAVYEQLLEKKYAPDEAARTARIENDLARLDVSPIRVCSPYQILRLLFEPKGVEGLMQSLAQARLIFDEIHAYKPEVTALTLAATQFLIEQLGAKVLFMTATLPAHLQEVVRSIFGELPVLRPDKDVMERPPRHKLKILRYDALSGDSIDAIKKAAKQGSVLVVANQVQRAVSLWERLGPEVSETRLLHSRFTNEDRFKIEKELAAGPGKVLVATQAVEVSLDVSYGTCFSELAPLESLLQRFGRCNRYGSETGDPAKVYVYAAFPDGAQGHLPYDELHLAATLDVIERCVRESNGLLIETGIEKLLNASYPENLKLQLKQEIASKCKKIHNNFDRDFMPFGSQEQSYFAELERQWEELFDGHEVLPESLRDKAAAESSWLARARYLVPISGKRFGRLRGQNKIEWCDELLCHIVKAPYTDAGLQA